MARNVVFSLAARDQLTQIYDHISHAASPAIALDFTNAVIEYCESFITFPERGTRRDDIRAGLRVMGFRRRVAIAFTVAETDILILGIFYGGQNYDRTLGGSD